MRMRRARRTERGMLRWESDAAVAAVVAVAAVQCAPPERVRCWSGCLRWCSCTPRLPRWSPLRLLRSFSCRVLV